MKKTIYLDEIYSSNQIKNEILPEYIKEGIEIKEEDYEIINDENSSSIILDESFIKDELMIGPQSLIYNY
jgi:hypothetical protein